MILGNQVIGRIYYKSLIEVKCTEKYYKYNCYKCKYKEWPPVDIVDEFGDMDKYCGSKYEEYQEEKRKVMPVMM